MTPKKKTPSKTRKSKEIVVPILDEDPEVLLGHAIGHTQLMEELLQQAWAQLQEAKQDLAKALAISSSRSVISNIAKHRKVSNN